MRIRQGRGATCILSQEHELLDIWSDLSSILLLAENERAGNVSLSRQRRRLQGFYRERQREREQHRLNDAVLDAISAQHQEAEARAA